MASCFSTHSFTYQFFGLLAEELLSYQTHAPQALWGLGLPPQQVESSCASRPPTQQLSHPLLLPLHPEHLC